MPTLELIKRIKIKLEKCPYFTDKEKDILYFALLKYENDYKKANDEYEEIK